MSQESSGLRRMHTVGHSTRPIEEFAALLHRHAVARIVDIRTVPKSRRNPQFEQHVLADSLASAGIDYVYLRELGGLRHSSGESVNMGWQNASFRHYADYMQTESFASGLADLEGLASERPSAIMCAEAVWWRCHRRLVADALLIRDWEVLEIISEAPAKPHTLTSFARVDGPKLTYPAPTRTQRQEISDTTLPEPRSSA